LLKFGHKIAWYPAVWLQSGIQQGKERERKKERERETDRRTDRQMDRGTGREVSGFRVQGLGFRV